MFEEKRRNGRVNLRFHIQYNKLLPDGSLGEPNSAVTENLSINGLSFFTDKKLNVEDVLIIKTFLPEGKSILFKTKIKRVEFSENANQKYEIGIGFDGLDEGTHARLENLLQKFNIYNIIDEIDLEKVMDIHFVAGYPPIIKFVGKLKITKGTPFSEEAVKVILLSLLDQRHYQNFLVEKEFNSVFSYKYKKKEEKRFRVNLHFQRGKIEGVFRVIPSAIPTPIAIGLTSVMEKLLLLNKSGLIIIAGRTGAGKTTTLASLISFLNKHRRGVVISVEKPIEFIHNNDKCIIKQREVGEDTKSFLNAAINSLRQNPDILVVGEIMDRETMEVVLSAAESGTLVLTSMHAPRTEQVLDRVTYFFKADLQPFIRTRLSLVLKSIVTQNLFPRVDEKGLVLASEVMVVNLPIRHAIRKGDWHQIRSMIETGRSSGMQLMKDSVADLYQNGLIDEIYVKEYNE